jgi:hypothetical protein
MLGDRGLNPPVSGYEIVASFGEHGNELSGLNRTRKFTAMFRRARQQILDRKYIKQVT